MVWLASNFNLSALAFQVLPGMCYYAWLSSFYSLPNRQEQSFLGRFCLVIYLTAGYVFPIKYLSSLLVIQI